MDFFPIPSSKIMKAAWSAFQIMKAACLFSYADRPGPSITCKCNFAMPAQPISSPFYHLRPLLFRWRLQRRCQIGLSN